MFLNDLWLGFLYALVLVVPITAVSLIGARRERIEGVLITSAVLIVCCGLFNWLWFWGSQPIIGTTQIAINHEFWRTWWVILVVACIIGYFASGDDDDAFEGGRPTAGSFVILLVLVVTLFYGVDQQGIWNSGRAKTLAHQVQVTMEKPDSFPDTDPNNIRQVSEQSADYYANQVLSSNAHMSTDWEIQQGGGVLQSVNNHLYYIYQLYPTGYSNSTKLPNSADPGYVVVDAQDPTNSWLQTKDASGHAIRMIYYQGGYHWHAIGRFLWSHGYRDQIVSDLTLEVNDKWQPYYTAAVMKPTVNFNSDVPGSAMVLNPQNGKITTYPIKNGYPQGLPGWVDRIYSSTAVINMMNYWGEWNFAPYNLIHETSNNRYQVVGTPTLVYADSGHPVWQVEISSQSADTGVAYLALFDGRDDHVQLYQIPKLTQHSQAQTAIEGISANTKKLSVEDLSLYKIYGQLTWVGALVCNQGDGFTPCAPQGMAMVPYDHLDAASVAFAPSMQQALQQYEQVLTSDQTSGNVQQNGLTKTISGVVTRLSEVDSSGNTVWYFMLVGDTSDVYSASMQDSSNAVNIALPFVQDGDTVTFSYLNTGAQVRQVMNGAPFDIKGLSISNK